MNAATASFWNDYCSAEGLEKCEPYDVYKIGNDPKTADEGARLVLEGTKTTTSALPEEFGGMKPLFEGALSVLLNGEDSPCAVLKTIHVETIPFSKVNAAFANAYGEFDRTLETWRAQMKRYYKKVAERLNIEWNEDHPLVCETFKLVYSERNRAGLQSEGMSSHG